MNEIDKYKKKNIDTIELINNNNKKIKQEGKELLDNYHCTICTNIASFPVTYQCSKHIACFTCIHEWFDKNKIYKNLIYVCKINCTVCDGDNYVNVELDQFKPLGLINIKIRNDLFKSILFTKEDNDIIGVKKREELCPTCFVKIDLFTNYEHVYVCSERKIKCDFCLKSILSKTKSIDKHFDNICNGFMCGTCKYTGLTRKQQSLHLAHNLFITKMLENMPGTKILCKQFIKEDLSQPNIFNKLLNQYDLFSSTFDKIDNYIRNPGVRNMDKINEYFILSATKQLSYNIDVSLIQSILHSNNNNNISSSDDDDNNT